MTYSVKDACLSVEVLVLGPLANNVYIIDDGTLVLVVDPSCEPDTILSALQNRPVGAIVLTHKHADHVGAAAEIRAATNALVVASRIDAPTIRGDEEAADGLPLRPCPVDHEVAHGDILKIGSMPWKVIGTPGHTPGGICLFIDPRFGTNTSGAPLLISGDTLFCGTIGRTDFEGGSLVDMRHSLKRLATLPDETIVLPGHNHLTTIGAERERVFARYAALDA